MIFRLLLPRMTFLNADLLGTHRVYTALEKGFHTPEFIYDALKDRRSPKERKHDVYCSGCGHLTTMRRRQGTPPEVPKVNKKPLWKDKCRGSWPGLQNVQLEKDAHDL